MKIIKAFRVEDHSPGIIDLTDARCSMSINKDGDVLLDEGAGGDRYHVVAITLDQIIKFDLTATKDSQKFHLVLRLIYSPYMYFLGETSEEELAWNWINRVNKFLESTRKRSHKASPR